MLYCYLNKADVNYSVQSLQSSIVLLSTEIVLFRSRLQLEGKDCYFGDNPPPPPNGPLILSFMPCFNSNMAFLKSLG